MAVSHGALANLLGAMRHRPGLRDTDIVAAVTTISFDIAALELYLPLTVGARIQLVSHDAAADGDGARATSVPIRGDGAAGDARRPGAC